MAHSKQSNSYQASPILIEKVFPYSFPHVSQMPMKPPRLPECCTTGTTSKAEKLIFKRPDWEKVLDRRKMPRAGEVSKMSTDPVIREICQGLSAVLAALKRGTDLAQIREAGGNLKCWHPLFIAEVVWL